MAGDVGAGGAGGTGPSHLLEGLENIDEEEQLRRLLEMSRREDTGTTINSSSLSEEEQVMRLLEMSKDDAALSSSWGSPPKQGVRWDLSLDTEPPNPPVVPDERVEDLNKWLERPVEERIEEFTAGDSEGHLEQEKDQETYLSSPEFHEGIQEEELDEDLRRAIEMSKKETVLSQEERTRLLMKEFGAEAGPQPEEDELAAAIRLSLESQFHSQQVSVAGSYGVRPAPDPPKPGQGEDQDLVDDTLLHAPSHPPPTQEYLLPLPKLQRRDGSSLDFIPLETPVSQEPITLVDLTAQERIPIVDLTAEVRADSRGEGGAAQVVPDLTSSSLTNVLSEEEQLEIAMRISRSESQSKNHIQHQQQHQQVTTIRPAATWSNFTPGSPRLVVVDGSNVGIHHGGNRRDKVFSVRGLELVIEYFRRLGNEVHVVLPKSRWNRSPPGDRLALDRLEEGGSLVYTPSRRTEDRTWDSYDDRFIIKIAVQNKGVIVTNDNYRDLIGESPEFKEQIIQRLLPYTWFKDDFMPSDDPLGKNGPNIKEFLRH